MPDILFIANLVPYPLDSGGKIKTFTSIQALSKKYTIDLLCFYESENENEAKKALQPYCRTIKMFPIRVTTREHLKYIIFQALKTLLSPIPLTVYKYHKKIMEESIYDLMKKNTYYAAYFNILQVYSYKKLIKSHDKNMKFILDAQNCETLILKRYYRETKNLVKKIYLYIEAFKLKIFECSSINDVDKLILLSNEDKKKLEKMSNKKIQCDIIPIGINPPEKVKSAESFNEKGKLCILFLGTLTWAPNNEGIIWFLENVIPKLEQNINDFKLYIVGKNPGKKLCSLTLNNKHIELTGYVDSVEPYFEKCDLMVVPLFIGSGQRVKIIESFSRGMPVVSTSIGAEGLEYVDGESILIADDSASFANKIIELNDVNLRKKLSVNGKKIYQKNYSVNAVSDKICSAVDALRN